MGYYSHALLLPASRRVCFLHHFTCIFWSSLIVLAAVRSPAARCWYCFHSAVCSIISTGCFYCFSPRWVMDLLKSFVLWCLKIKLLHFCLILAVFCCKGTGNLIEHECSDSLFSCVFMLQTFCSILGTGWNYRQQQCTALSNLLCKSILCFQNFCRLLVWAFDFPANSWNDVYGVLVIEDDKARLSSHV